MLGVPLLARIVAELAHSLTGIDIHPGAEIGRGFFIDHGTGVVIGETAVIGERVRIYQAVTLGAKTFPTDDKGHLQKGLPRHPIVEDDVVIYAGATVLGRITIGKGSIIGGNVWLTRSVPPGSSITQASSRQQLPMQLPYLIAENSVAVKKVDSTPATIGPFASLSERTFIHSGSAENAFHAASAAARFLYFKM